MAYTPIAKLDNFMGEEDDAQIWLNDNDARAMQAILYFLKNTTNLWYQSLINKPQDFNAFKAEFLRYFSNNNSINCLVNAFTTIKQGETEAVTTYLGCFHQNLRQIQAIDTNYFTIPQILNQFICGLCNAVTCARDFESTESEANHAQAINLIMNGSSELDSKLEKFSELINKRLKGYLPSQRRNNQGNSNHAQNQSHPSSSTNQQWQQEMRICHYCVPKSKPTYLPTSDAVISLLVPSISTSDLSAAATSNILTAATNNLSTLTDPNTAPKLTIQWNPKTENDSTELKIGNSSSSTDLQFFTATIWITPVEFSLLVTPKDASTNNSAFTQKQPLTSNIPSVTITKDESLATIFSFEFEETAATLLFSGAALEAKPITAMYTDTKVKGQSIKLILDSGSAGSIITRQLMDQLGCQVDQAASTRIITADGVTKTPISKIDDFSFEVNDIVTFIKVLVMEATQYQALVDAEPVINFLEPEEFHEHYQNLALTREEQEQWLAQLNTKLCRHCLIPNDFEYCDDCDFIYNLPPHMIYSIPEEEEPISSCASESESLINRDPDSDNDDKNTNLDSKPNLNYEQYIALPDLSKKQELKWYSDNGEGIMLERVHDTDAEFDLRYPGKDAIKLEPHSRICIDLKIALEIPATTMVQLASRSSLAKKVINIRGEIIDTGYVRNIITMLQNDSKKVYIIEPNKKIAQTIFLPLIRVAQLVSVGKREKLGITAREIQGFESTGRTNIPVNMAEEEIVGQGKIISTGQAIFIPPYSQYMLAIERKEKKQKQIFEAEATLCESGEIGLINLYIPAKSYSSIKIPIYNNTGNVINILEETTIGYLTTEIEDQPPNPIPDFPQLCGYVDITSQTIYG
ncbi:hypothetical protein G9A89_009386 [Geosiphon pyriformis]|nr:hypothetical protein G9A89_009386 [Geosiphon pyriformis]